MKKDCKSCGKPIHPKRLEILPNSTTCVECSNTGRKAGVTVTKGEGDHTYNDIVIMEPEEFKKWKDFEQGFEKAHFDDEIPNTPPDEEEGSSVDDIIDNTKLD